jgi:hypothetical protein
MSLLTTLAAFGLAATVPAVSADTACQVLKPENVPVQGRRSPLDSLTVTVGNQPVKLCYGRPSARGRTMIGGPGVPYGKLWRTGANEPTIFFTPIPLRLAGIMVPPGKYSLYTVPGPEEWEIIVNRSTSQWGHESEYTEAVKAREVGRGKVAAEATKAPVETFTIRAEPGQAEGVLLVLEWEKTRVPIPVSPAS